LSSSITLIASVLGRVLVRRADAHASTALGAARLACMARGGTEG
jgi:glycerol kinase